MSATVRTGLDVLRAHDFAPLRGKRVGLVTHPAAVSTPGLGPVRSAVELFLAAPGVTLTALFGPEHGLTGEAQDLIPVAAGGADRGVLVHSLYGDTFASLTPTAAMLRGLDELVIDLQDVGSRYYTFQGTMLYCLEAAAAVRLPVTVLDRPNPIGGAVEGPAIRPGYESFVGPHPIPTRHGMTMGELARLYKSERVPDVQLTVVPCEGWDRRAFVPWVVPPSPNMPDLITAVVYPGMCLVEGTNVSEGRGTTRPFQFTGFPGAPHHDIVDRLRGENHPGLDVLPAAYRPTFQKHAGQTCHGLLLAVTDPNAVRPVRAGLAVIAAFRELLGERFRWRTETYEFVSHIPAIDLLFGSDRERRALEAGTSWPEVAAAWEPEETAFLARRERHLIYPG